MPFFKYKSLTSTGNLEKGDGFFSSKETLEKSLREAGSQLLSFKEQKITKPWYAWGGLSHAQALHILGTLATLLGAGFSLLASLQHLLKDEENTHQRACLFTVIHDLQHGETLDRSLGKYPVFKPHILCLIHLGLQGGDLAKSIHKAYQLMETEETRQQKLRRATLYPLILLCLFIGMVIVFTHMLLPQISEYLREMGVQELPPLTRALMHTSSFMEGYGHIFVGFLCLILGGVILVPRFPFLQKKLTPLLFTIPIFGKMIMIPFQNHWLFYVEQLYGSGLNFKATLDFVAKTCANVYVQNLFDKAHAQIFAGKPMIEVLRGTGVFSNLTLSLIQAGAESGRLVETCERAFFLADKSYHGRVEDILKYVEPGLLLLMGTFLLWIVLAVITPIYDHLVV
jgi:general secretion pathway protein F